MMRSLGLFVLVLSGIVAAGCAKEDGYAALNLVEVTGQVTLDGQPLAGARVLFEGKDGPSSEGVTDAEGNYRLMYDSEHAGCTPGTKIVRITLAGASEEGADPDAAAGGGEGAASAETIPARYNSASTLTAEVSESNATFNFELLSEA